jgi:hypothetical protein
MNCILRPPNVRDQNRTFDTGAVEVRAFVENERLRIHCYRGAHEDANLRLLGPPPNQLMYSNDKGLALRSLS